MAAPDARLPVAGGASGSFGRVSSYRCARPACPGQASAWLAYDYQARCAWLDDLGTGDPREASQWPLCERHADGLKVPRGWSSVDRRLDGQGIGPSRHVNAPKAPKAPKAPAPGRSRSPQAQTALL